MLFAIASLAAARFTESDRFCGTDCHEMWPYRDAWEKSTHSGVACVECHIPPGVVNFVETKVYASREVWVHFTGQVKAPIKVTRHIPDSACMRDGCHTTGETRQTLKLGSPAPVTFRHGSEGHAVQLCVDCHGLRSWTGGKSGGPHPGGALTGKHGQVSCEACHTGGVSSPPDGCIDCHGDHHNGLTTCVDCHSIQD